MDENNSTTNNEEPQNQNQPTEPTAESQSIPVTVNTASETPGEPATEAVEETPAEVAQEPVSEAEPAAAEQPSTEAPQEPAEQPNAENETPTPVMSAPATADEPVAASNEQAPVTDEPKKSGKKSTLLLFIIAGVLLLAAAAAAWFFLGNKKTEEKTKTVVNDIALLRVGDINGPIGADMVFPNAPAAQTSAQIDFQVYEGLVGYKDQKIVPLLATSWTNPDNNTWVFKIKEGVQFHNGKTMTAQDVKTSIDSLAKDEYWGQYAQTIKSVTVSGPNEVTIVTNSPDSLLLNRLAFCFVYQTNADKTTSGTGAYTVDVANSKTEDKTKLLAFDNYHQGRPKTRAVEFTIYKDYGPITTDLENGKLDYANLNNSSEREKSLSSKGFSTTNYESSGAYGITMNMIKANSPLQKIAVRQALSYAIDKAKFATTGSSSSSPSNYILPKSVVGYDETAKFPDFDTAKAKDTLTKAGYPNALPLTLNYISGIQDDVLSLKDNFTKAGFNVTFKPYASPKEFVQATSAGNYDLFAGSFNSDLGDGLDIFSGLLGSETAQFPSYNNPEFDKMLADASQAFKPEDHVKKVQEINRYVKDNTLWIPVTVGTSAIYYHNNYNFTLDSTYGVSGMYFWKLGETQTTKQ